MKITRIVFAILTLQKRNWCIRDARNWGVGTISHFVLDAPSKGAVSVRT